MRALDNRLRPKRSGHTRARSESAAVRGASVPIEAAAIAQRGALAAAAREPGVVGALYPRRSPLRRRRTPAPRRRSAHDGRGRRVRSGRPSPARRARQQRSMSSAYIHCASSKPPIASQASRRTSKKAPVTQSTLAARDGIPVARQAQALADRGGSACTPTGCAARRRRRPGTSWTPGCVEPSGRISRGPTTPAPPVRSAAATSAASAPGSSSTSAFEAATQRRAGAPGDLR